MTAFEEGVEAYRINPNSDVALAVFRSNRYPESLWASEFRRGYLAERRRFLEDRDDNDGECVGI